MRTSRAGFTALSKCGAQQVVLFVLTELSSHTELQLTESLIHSSYQRHTYQRQCFRQRHFCKRLQTEKREFSLVCSDIHYKQLKLQS